MTTFNLADMFEMVADHVPDRTAIVAGDRRLTYAELDARANRLAHALVGVGIGERDRVGLQLLNGTEYVEGMIACFKIRAVPINVNHRYVEGELRHLFDDADLGALLVHRRFAERVAAIQDGLPLLRHVFVVEDGTDEPAPGTLRYEEALAAASPARDFPPRSPDDIYCAYTGGTTGLPKGVVWRHEDIFFAGMGGGDLLRIGNVVKRPEELLERIYDVGLVAVPTPPFMHVSAHWLVFQMLLGAGTIVVPPPERFDPDAVWRLVATERAHILVIVGDAMAVPLANALERGGYDASTLMTIGSGGAVLSPQTKERLRALLPNCLIVDGFGSSETGTLGSQPTMEGTGPAKTLRIPPNEDTAVLDDSMRPVSPGAVGRLARRGHIPLGYHKDPKKTAASFVEAEGVRWVLPGDMATVEEDGTIVLLGRGSVSINTGGEKVFPEEVETVLKEHPGVADAVVVGVPDERWGERVVAVVQPGRTAPTLEDLRAFAREKLAGYKVPRDLVLVPRIERQPSAKPDYRWARERAIAALAPKPRKTRAPETPQLPLEPAPRTRRARKARDPLRARRTGKPKAPLRALGHPGARRDPDTIRRWQRVLERYASYYRPDVRGFENLPERGPFLLVGNHSGGATPPDMPILLTAWWRQRGVEEPVYGLFHSFFIGLPGVREPLTKFGAIEASWDSAGAILRDGGIVLVYPGGDHDAFRPWTQRNRIDFAGRTGFVKLALRARVPVVPVVSHGVQDSIFVVSRGEALLRFQPYLERWRLKVAPILLGPPWGVTLGLPTIPLPTKATVQICPPVDLAAEHGAEAADDDEILRACYERITGGMQTVLDQLASERSLINRVLRR